MEIQLIQGLKVIAEENCMQQETPSQFHTRYSTPP